jgi:hypothetical protein
MAKKVKYNRFYPDEDDPRYGQKFMITGIQLKDIDGQYTGWVDVRIRKKDTIAPMWHEVGKNWGEWVKNKKKLKELLINILDESGCEVNYREVSAIRGQYIKDLGKNVIL